MKKYLGYLIAIVGLLLIAISTLSDIKDATTTFLNIDLKPIPDLAFTIIGIAFVAVGLFLVLKSPRSGGHSKGGIEVPIYQGNRVVGYRRH